MSKTNITREEIIDICEFDDVPAYGNVMTYEDFTEQVESGCIMDYDGEGEVILFDEDVVNSSVVCDEGVVVFYTCTDKFRVSFEALYAMFGDDVAFVWFGK